MTYLFTLSTHMFRKFAIVFLLLISGLITLCSENTLCMILIFWHFLFLWFWFFDICIVAQDMVLLSEYSVGTWEDTVYSAFLGWGAPYVSIRSCWLIVLFWVFAVFCLAALSVAERKIFKSKLWLWICLFSFQLFHLFLYVFWGSVVYWVHN